MVRMKHDDHGFTHADSPQEVERLVVGGWVVEDQNEIDVSHETVETPEIRPAKRRGRPPKGQ